ncbi:GOLPH3/VPS74 family protein [Streptomyces sp. GS7]|uniref:GOLPH3/VPS74 family protein n=1 Tax=Streptomyces sp. GS7 TaxID=2692234 RepID=UPI0013195F77|nr:GPP34 family phosphoprotein [Streptomyces sp. GS7]QHC22096.1 GPP34 family phosphoprotein [Streptomyces sp. GS7]
MTTPRDLLLISLELTPRHPVERGDLSLALAAAEVIDLLGVEAVRLDGDRIVPGYLPGLSDRLLATAAESLVRDAPHETVDDWLWRRGRGLAEAYETVLEDEGLLTRQRHRGLPFRKGAAVPVDSPARWRAADRWAAQEPVLMALATALGYGAEPAEQAPGVVDEAVTTVLATVSDALQELAAVRQRRAIEEAAFENIWRGE